MAIAHSQPHKAALLLIGAMMVWGAATLAQTPPAAPAPATTPVAQEPFADRAGTPEGKIKSLLFTPEEVADIRYAINIYRKHASNKGDSDTFDEEDFLNKLTGIRKAPQASQFFTYPQYFLQSLVYHSANNWIIWIENQKITQDSPKNDAELSVLAIDQDKVTIQWRPISMDKVNAMWEKIPNDEVKVNKSEGTVIFTLKPNQTFSSYVMRPLEGRVQPVTVDTRNIELPAEEEVPRASGDTGEMGAKPSKEGLSGLIGAYSNIGKEAPELETQPPSPEKAP